MNTSPADGKRFVSTKTAATITLVWKKKKKSSQVSLKAFKIKASKMNKHRKTTTECELTFSIVQNGIESLP